MGTGTGNAYDRGDYNSSFALRAVELKISNKTGGDDRMVFRMSSKIILTYRSIFPPI